jgi:hypothetical protein
MDDMFITDRDSAALDREKEWLEDILDRSEGEEVEESNDLSAVISCSNKSSLPRGEAKHRCAGKWPFLACSGCLPDRTTYKCFDCLKEIKRKASRRGHIVPEYMGWL